MSKLVEAPLLTPVNGGRYGGIVVPGTRGSVLLRVLQTLLTSAALVVMFTTTGFPTLTAFWYLVAATGLGIIWRLSVLMIDVYATLAQCNFNNYWAVPFAVADVIISALRFAGVGAVFIANDLYGKNSLAFSCCCFLFCIESLVTAGGPLVR